MMNHDANHTDEDLTSTKRRRGGLSILDRIDASGDCWLWTGALDGKGYGQAGVNRKRVALHRFVWEALVGEIPEGLELDHLCRVRSCVNPDHLELVTHQENQRRSHAIKTAARRNLAKAHRASVVANAKRQENRTECLHGHLWVADNIRITNRGHKVCRLCTNKASKMHQRRRRQRD